MPARDALVSALHALLLRVLGDSQVRRDALDQVESLADHEGTGRLILIMDFQQGRRAWCQAVHLRRGSIRHAFDIAEITSPSDR